MGLGKEQLLRDIVLGWGRWGPQHGDVHARSPVVGLRTRSSHSSLAKIPWKHPERWHPDGWDGWKSPQGLHPSLQRGCCSQLGRGEGQPPTPREPGGGFFSTGCGVTEKSPSPAQDDHLLLPLSPPGDLQEPRRGLCSADMMGWSPLLKFTTLTSLNPSCKGRYQPLLLPSLSACTGWNQCIYRPSPLTRTAHPGAIINSLTKRNTQPARKDFHDVCEVPYRAEMTVSSRLFGCK